MSDETEWVMIGDVAFGVVAVFNRANWKARAAIADEPQREPVNDDGVVLLAFEATTGE